MVHVYPFSDAQSRALKESVSWYITLLQEHLEEMEHKLEVSRNHKDYYKKLLKDDLKKVSDLQEILRKMKVYDS